MSTFIECTNCHEVVEITATSVTLPFVCEVCEFQAAIQPASVAKIVAAAETSLNEDDATVENTTLLIADLEEQVRLLEERDQKANELLADMGQQLKEDAETIGEKDRALEALSRQECETHHLNERLQRDMSDLFSRLDKARAERDALAKQNEVLGIRAFYKNQGAARFAAQMLGLADEWDKERESLEYKLIREKQETKRVELAKDFYKRQAEYFRSRMKAYISTKHALLNRGIIARILNREPIEE